MLKVKAGDSRVCDLWCFDLCLPVQMIHIAPIAIVLFPTGRGLLDITLCDKEC